MKVRGGLPSTSTTIMPSTRRMDMQLRSIAFVTALCAFFTVQTEARTLYVDASRPNNKGNGLKLKTAKIR